MPPPH
jgi:hypothetical protein